MKEKYIPIGKIGASFGVKGWLKVYSYTKSDNVLNYSPLYISNENNQWTPIEVEQGRQHGKYLIVKIAHIDSPEQAGLLTGKLIAVNRTQFPELAKHEFYWSDLEGLTVKNKQGKILGKVIYLLETGSNDVLVVKGKIEFAIPYLPGQVILNIDLDRQEILVDWAEVV